jgi:predicted acetyltransferase
MIEIRTITQDEAEVFRDAVLSTFGGDRDDDPSGGDRVRALIAPGRAWAAFDGGAVVATAASFALTLGIPGGTLPMAGLTMVTVRPTHRRRGILRELIGRHLEDARQRGEPISGLWASEAAIYGRFGYGIAVESDALEIDTRGLTITDRSGATRDEDVCEWIDEAAARERLPGIYARAIADRPGALHRSEVWWRERRFLETPFMRGGASRRRHVLVRRGGEPVGYVAYRQRAEYFEHTPSGATEIVELIALDVAAEASLWRFILGIDLFPTAKWDNAPTDTTLPWIVSDARRVARHRRDTLWLRIDDVAATLSARRYPADGALRLALGEATWQLEVNGGQARCTQVDAAPELRFERAALGSVVLGGVSVALLARAGQITGAHDAVARADRLFAWPIVPWCPELF